MWCLFKTLGWGGCTAPQGESTPLAREIQLMLLAVDTRAPIAVAIVGTAAASGTGDTGTGGAASAGTKRGDKGIAVDRAWVKNKVYNHQYQLFRVHVLLYFSISTVYS
jgi:hypothetical protein